MMKLKNGSTLTIDSNYTGRITYESGYGINVSYTKDEYYNLLKENDIPIPHKLLKEGDADYGTLDPQFIKNSKNMY
jgi:hypothetical protein